MTNVCTIVLIVISQDNTIQNDDAVFGVSICDTFFIYLPECNMLVSDLHYSMQDLQVKLKN